MKHLDFSVYFDVVQGFCYCKDVNGLINAIGIEHEPTQLRIFIAVLLHNENKYPLIPIAYSIQMKED